MLSRRGGTRRPSAWVTIQLGSKKWGVASVEKLLTRIIIIIIVFMIYPAGWEYFL
jgi:tryptophan-rich sensory protein